MKSRIVCFSPRLLSPTCAALAVVASVLALGPHALAQDQAHAQHQDQSMASASQGKMSSGSQQLHQSMMKGMQEMQKMMSMSGDTDKDFATMMIHHHRQAIEMARVELAQGKNSDLKQQAQKIIDDSQKDIAVLQKHAGSEAKSSSR